MITFDTNMQKIVIQNLTFDEILDHLRNDSIVSHNPKRIEIDNIKHHPKSVYNTFDNVYWDRFRMEFEKMIPGFRYTLKYSPNGFIERISIYQ
jgi:hypothetical protein